jgi:RimJ/RimL family protein N-acetyltransferase
MMSNCRRFDTAITGQDFREFSYHLLNDRNFLPDVLLDMKRMLEEYQFMMGRCCQPFALVDGKNQIGGVFFISDVVPQHEATFFYWQWLRGVITPATLRFVNEYIEHYAEEYQLARVVCRTPDDKGLGRLLEALGFKLEGRFRNAYKSGGVLTTLYQYRRLFRFGGCV